MSSSEDKISIGLALLVVNVVLAAAAYGLFNLVLERRAELEQTAIRRAEKVKECKHVGYYGRYGEYKVYDCDGKIIRETEL